VTRHWTERSLCLTGQCSASARVFVFDRTRWRVRSLSIGRVRSFRELTGLQPDAGTIVSSQFYSVSGRCFVVRSLFLTNVFGQLWDQRVQSIPVRSVAARSTSGRWFASIAVVRSACPVSLTSASGQLDFGCFSF
jgi:hypothetical protein